MSERSATNKPKTSLDSKLEQAAKKMKESRQGKKVNVALPNNSKPSALEAMNSAARDALFIDRTNEDRVLSNITEYRATR